MSDCILSYDQLRQMVKNPHLEHWYECFEQLLPDYDINTPLRVAHFIAQCAHESGNFVFIKENLNYKAASLRKIFGKYFPTDELAAQYANKPERIANRIYANRMGNGDEASGDGYRYCGRGLIQLTGRSLYEAFAREIGKDLDETVVNCETFDGAIESACFFWEHHNLNAVSDTGDIVHATKIINGGTLGLEDRTARYKHALSIFGA